VAKSKETYDGASNTEEEGGVVRHKHPVEQISAKGEKYMLGEEGVSVSAGINYPR
jgi:hypothetical protein